MAQINKPNQHFNTVLYTGNGSTQSITNVNFKSDWTWLKARSESASHEIFDSVRGATKTINSNTTNAEATQTDSLTSFDSDGFTLGSNGDLNYNGSTYVGWNWKAGGATPTQTYSVKVVSDSGNKYRFDDFGTSAVTIDLQEGGTYTFDQSDSSNSGHPLRFSTTSNGTHGGGSEYTTGVTVTGTAGTSGAKTVITVASSAPTLYYYCTVHSGMGGQVNTNSTFGSSNFSGTIQSKVSANTDSGFSVVTYTATSGTYSTGHGLNSTPSMIILKAIDQTSGWVTGLSVLGWDKYMSLNSTSTPTTDDRMFSPSGGTDPTSTLFWSNQSAIGNAGTMVSYCFAEKKGFSKFGSYVGNPSVDGTFLYLGFKPAFLIVKGSTTAESWILFDNARSPSNAVDKRLLANATNSETSDLVVNFVSNGVKFKSDQNAIDHANTYTYMAFAENPLVGTNGVPATAR